MLAIRTAARMLFETSVPTRFYVPRDDVRANVERSATRGYCPYEGHVLRTSSDSERT